MRDSLVAALFIAVTLVGCAGSLPSESSSRIDHVVVGVPDLQSAIAEVERRAGVRPIPGGSHPGRGTHNALLSLGDGTYLELIAPEPGSGRTTGNADLMALEEPTPIDWAVTVENAESVAASLRRLHFNPGIPEAGSRRTDSGELLEWRTFGLDGGPSGAPFFIEWAAGSPHPSQTSPSGCSLLALEIASPDATALQRLVIALGLDVGASSAPAPRLSLTLQCPRGRVRFPNAA